MNTSYFARINKLGNRNFISVARTQPKGFNLPTALELVPSEHLLRDFKNGLLSETEYIKIYFKEVLSKLNPGDVYEKYKDCVLICWEKSDKFCHRHIISKWLEQELSVSVEEI